MGLLRRVAQKTPGGLNANPKIVPTINGKNFLIKSYSFFLTFTFPPTFLIPFTFHLPTTLYLISLFIFPFIFIYYVYSSSYPPIINFSLSFLSYTSMHNFPSQKRLFLSLNFLVDFYFLFFLHLYLRLLIFCIFKNSTLS